MADLRQRPVRALRRIEDEIERFPVSQPLELDHAQHVQHIDVARVFLERAPIEGLRETKRAGAMRGQRLGAR